MMGSLYLEYYIEYVKNVGVIKPSFISDARWKAMLNHIFREYLA